MPAAFVYHLSIQVHYLAYRCEPSKRVSLTVNRDTIRHICQLYPSERWDPWMDSFLISLYGDLGTGPETIQSGEQKAEILLRLMDRWIRRRRHKAPCGHGLFQTPQGILVLTFSRLLFENGQLISRAMKSPPLGVCCSYQIT